MDLLINEIKEIQKEVGYETLSEFDDEIINEFYNNWRFLLDNSDDILRIKKLLLRVFYIVNIFGVQNLYKNIMKCMEVMW